MELREKIADQLEASVLWNKSEGRFFAERMADRILAIPEIREALELKAIRDSKVGYERQG